MRFSKLPTPEEKAEVLKQMDEANSELARKLIFLEFLGKLLARQNILPPVIVGGTAVKLYTSGQYGTPDIDILGLRRELLEILESLGFQNYEGDAGSIH